MTIIARSPKDRGSKMVEQWRPVRGYEGKYIVSNKGNVIHAVETGLFGERAKKATPEIVAAIRAEYVPYSREHSTMALGKKYGIDPAYVWRIIHGKKRKQLP